MCDFRQGEFVVLHDPKIDVKPDRIWLRRDCRFHIVDIAVSARPGRTRVPKKSVSLASDCGWRADALRSVWTRQTVLFLGGFEMLGEKSIHLSDEVR